MSAEFSADKSQIITAASDGTARIWNASNADPWQRMLPLPSVFLVPRMEPATRGASSYSERAWCCHQPCCFLTQVGRQSFLQKAFSATRTKQSVKLQVGDSRERHSSAVESFYFLRKFHPAVNVQPSALRDHDVDTFSQRHR